MIPWIVMFIGVFMLLSDNSRIQRIEEYNIRAAEWAENGLNEFRSVSLTTNDLPMIPVTETSGKYYPVRDSCEKDGDPADKCVYTQALFYQAYAPVSSSLVSVAVLHDSESIVSQQYQPQHTEIYSETELGCGDDDDDCESKCRNKHGTWNPWYGTCTVITYLNNLCYRVNKVNDHWQLDQPPAWALSYSDAGCYYSNKYNPATYGYSYVSQIPVQIRYYKDSFISADELTFGCSSSSTSSDSCFGMSRKEQNVTGSVLSAIGVLLVILEIAAVVGLCLCCRDTLKSLTSTKHRHMKAYPDAVPVAAPAYGQPQPPYGQPQPQPQYGQPAANPYMPPPGH